jgi:hypothetical protein
MKSYYCQNKANITFAPHSTYKQLIYKYINKFITYLTLYNFYASSESYNLVAYFVLLVHIYLKSSAGGGGGDDDDGGGGDNITSCNKQCKSMCIMQNRLFFQNRYKTLNDHNRVYGNQHSKSIRGLYKRTSKLTS